MRYYWTELKDGKERILGRSDDRETAEEIAEHLAVNRNITVLVIEDENHTVIKTFNQ